LNTHFRAHHGAFAAAGTGVFLFQLYRVKAPAIGLFRKNQVLFRAKMNAQPAGFAFFFINYHIAPSGFGFRHFVAPADSRMGKIRI